VRGAEFVARLRRANFLGARGGLLSSAPAAGYFFRRLRRPIIFRACGGRFFQRLRRSVLVGACGGLICTVGVFALFGACGGVLFWRVRRANIFDACGELFVSAPVAG